ncbi:MAG: ROK family protein, partial [Spirochaetota bacterium]
MKYLAAVDIGGTKITVSIANRSGFIGKVYQPARKEGDVKTIPRQVKYLVDRACHEAKIQPGEIDGVGVSTCSPFELREGNRIVVAPNLCGGLARHRENRPPNEWTGIPLEEELKKYYKRVKIENDGVSAAVAERTFGAGDGEDNMVYVTWSTGIGAGAYVDGILIKGKNGNAPHLGHIYIAEDGPQCGCGNYGDMEALTSGTAIARDYGEGKSAKDVFQLYREGNKKAVRIVARAARNFARGLASINALLDTRVFVLGGSIMKDDDIVMPMVKDEYYRSFPALSRDTEFRMSALEGYLGDMAGLSLV